MPPLPIGTLKSYTDFFFTSVWGIADGAGKVGVDEEIIAYAVLDVLAKPIFGAWLLFTHQSIPETQIELGGFWSQGLSGEGGIRVGDDDEGA